MGKTHIISSPCCCGSIQMESDYIPSLTLGDSCNRIKLVAHREETIKTYYFEGLSPAMADCSKSNKNAFSNKKTTYKSMCSLLRAIFDKMNIYHLLM